MSEKLYKVVEAVDLLDTDSHVPKRCLVFMDQAGNRFEESFPKDRMTLLFNEGLYDWYGRRVMMPISMDVLSHFGFYTTGSRVFETFVVKSDNNHRLAIAHLDYQYPLKNPHQKPPIKIRTTDPIIYGTPFLHLRHRWSFAKFQEPPTTDGCLHEINKQLCENFGFTCKICTGVASLYQSYYGIAFVKTYEDGEDNSWSSFWLKNCILEERSFAFDQSHLILEAEKTTLDGDLSFSEDGEKITISLRSPLSKQHARISTDIEVIRATQCRDKCIYWYYDPEL